MTHDIDRTQVEFGQTETFEYPTTSGVFSPNQEMDLAAQLLGVSHEADLEYFIGDLISKASQAVGRFVSSPTGQALGGLLKQAASQVLPMVGQAIGSRFGGPAGGQIGSQIASAAGRAFGLDTEVTEQDFEAAQTFVRMAGDAVKNAASAPPGANPQAVASAAVTQAAQVHAPGLVASGAPPLPGMPGALAKPEFPTGTPGAPHARSGRWIRRHSTIVLFGV